MRPLGALAIIQMTEIGSAKLHPGLSRVARSIERGFEPMAAHATGSKELVTRRNAARVAVRPRAVVQEDAGRPAGPQVVAALAAPLDERRGQKLPH